MQEKTLNELGNRAAETLTSENTLSAVMRKEQAKAAITEQLTAMQQEDKILLLDEDEENMLRAFRRFRLRAKPGDLFRWRAARLTDPKVGTYRETGLVIHPQEK